MNFRQISFRRAYRGAWVFLLGAGIIISLWSAVGAASQEDVAARLAAGEIIVSTTEVDGTCIKSGEMTGIIDAPPEIVWQVITDVNNFKDFMPRTLASRAVAPDKLPAILRLKPTQAEEVERLLGPTPMDPASCRIPGGKYTVYFYSHLNFPWPAQNRWYIIKGVQDETHAGQHLYRSSWSLVIGNLKENSGEWILEPYGSHATKAIYRLRTDPGGCIPGFLVKQGTYNTMPQIIAAVRKRAASLLGYKQP